MLGVATVYYESKIGLKEHKFPEALRNVGVRGATQWYADDEGPEETIWNQENL